MATIHSKSTARSLTLSIDGNIHGEQSFPVLSDEIQSVTLDFCKLGYINSSGIRSWLAWKKDVLDKMKINVIVTNCPRIFIDQLSMIANLLPSSTQIKSFKVPYFIEESGDIHEILYEKDVDFVGPDVKYKEFIEIDGKKAEIDVDINTYFSFLRHFN